MKSVKTHSFSRFVCTSFLAVGVMCAVNSASYAQTSVPAPAAPTLNGSPAAVTPMPAPVVMPVGMAPAMVAAPALEMPSFTPTEGWGVTKTSLAQARGLQDVRLPCLMTTEFDNGFVVRLSGGGGSILAMAIDFRQSVFKKGHKYSAVVSMAGMTKQISATAFAPNILLFNTRDWPGFYGAVAQGTDMVIDVEGNVMRFMMSDIEGGLKKLEHCFNPNAGQGAPMPMGAPLTPMSPIAGSPVEAMPPQSPQSDSIPSLSRQPNLNKNEFQGSGPGKTQIWSASAGETLDVVLARWGAQAGVDVSWQAGAPIPVQNDLQFRGGFTQAVQTLMAQNAAISGLKANLVGDMQTATPAPPTPLVPMGSISSRDTAVSSVAADIAGRWSAPAGSSVQGVLALWAQQEGVEFVWQSSQNFALKRGINAGNSFEAAVQSVLEQFVNDPLRPTARLNKDPNTGQRVLFVFSDRG
ncbi:MAG: TcpQ domain-containing protein [Alphaproteobacteria bacterium]|nr:TcpQ domain-containing protein [Alphaproteobacteria bacterium]